MTELLETRAELTKLARLLGVEPHEIAYLEKLDSTALETLRRQLMDVFYGHEDGGLQRVAKIGNLLPASAIAALTKEAVGPVLAARVAGMVDPQQAVAVVSKLPVKFVTDITVQIDPRRIEPVIGAMPPKTSAAIARELVKRGEHVTMGQFMGFMDEAGLVASFAEMTDADLLKIAFVAEHKERLPIAVEALTDERLLGIMKVATRDRLWPQALDLLRHMDDDQYFRLIDIASSLDAKSQDALVSASFDDDLWPITIPAIAQMTDPSKPVAALLRADDKAARAFAEAIITDHAWEDARELLEKLGAKQLADLRKRFSASGQAKRMQPVADLISA